MPQPDEAVSRFMPLLLVGLGCLDQCRPWMAVLAGVRTGRNDRGRGGGLASPSPDGGREEFRDVLRSRSSNSAIRSCARANSPRRNTTSAAST